MEWSWWPTFLFVLTSYLLWTVVKRMIRKLLTLHWGTAQMDGVAIRGKVVVITGAGSGVGFETAVALANRGATVVVTGRTLKAARKLVIRIRNRTFLGKLIPLPLELSSLKSISTFAEALKERVTSVDLLINNAGLLFPVTKREKSTDGFEIQFAVNHLAHFYLTSLLLPLMKNKPSRIVVVSSLNHQGVSINFDDLMYENTEIHDTSMSGNVLYKQSKLANVLFANELRRRLKQVGADIKVYVCCPGVVNTAISRHLDIPWYASIFEPVIGIIFKTPEEGSQSILHAAVTDEDEQSGILFRHCKPWHPGYRTFPDDLLQSTAVANYSKEHEKRLWIESERLCGKKFEV